MSTLQKDKLSVSYKQVEGVLLPYSKTKGVKPEQLMTVIANSAYLLKPENVKSDMAPGKIVEETLNNQAKLDKTLKPTAVTQAAFTKLISVIVGFPPKHVDLVFKSFK